MQNFFGGLPVVKMSQLKPSKKRLDLTICEYVFIGGETNLLFTRQGDSDVNIFGWSQNRIQEMESCPYQFTPHTTSTIGTQDWSILDQSSVGICPLRIPAYTKSLGCWFEIWDVWEVKLPEKLFANLRLRDLDPGIWNGSPTELFWKPTNATHLDKVRLTGAQMPGNFKETWRLVMKVDEHQFATMITMISWGGSPLLYLCNLPNGWSMLLRFCI